MGINVHINYEAEIDEWISRNPEFSFLKNISVPQDSCHGWRTNHSRLGYVDKNTWALQVMFIGKTGYGKSTTLNRLVGKNVFETSEVSACTKDLYNSKYLIDPKIPSFFNIVDLPGIGESNYADTHYYDWYREMLVYSDIAVYVLRADQRDFALDEVLFKSMFSDEEKKNKVLMALNFADKVEPINRTYTLSQAQLNNIDKKIFEVSRIFGIPEQDIVYYSAKDGTNFDALVKRIASKLQSVVFTRRV